jgi:hypothetical protein
MRSISPNIGFAVCLTAGRDEDLQIGKVYRILPDAKAAEVGCLRVVDDSGEDYLYASKRFVKLDLSEQVRSRLLKAVRSEANLVRRRRNGIVSNGRRRR